MKAIKIAAGVVVVLIVGIVVILSMVDVNQYRGLIQDQAKAATGREVSVGEIELAISLSPAIVVHDIKVGNAPWGSRADMVIAERVAAHTQLIPLIFGTVNIGDLEVIGADVLLETNAEGKGNWEFDVESAPSEESTPLNVSGVSAERLKFAYRDAVSGMSADISAESIGVEIAGALMDMVVPSVELDGVEVAYAEGPTKAEAKIGVMRMTSKGAITDFNISNISVNDTIASYTNDGTPLDVAVETFSLDNDGALDLTAKLSGQDIKASGQIASIAQLMAREGEFPVQLAVDGFGLKADTDLIVSLAADRPSATGKIDIAEIVMPSASDESEAFGASSSDSGKVFPAAPLPWDTLAVANADVVLSIAKVTLSSGMEIENIAIPVKLSGSKLSVDPVSLSLAGGTVTAGLGMDATNKSVSLSADIAGMNAESLAKAMQQTDLVTEGPLDLKINVRGSGDTVQAVAASLGGSVVGGMGQSRIRSDALNVIGADVLMQVASAINPLGNKDPYTVAKCMVVNFQISNGVARTDKGIALVTDKMQVTSSGQIDLREERVSLNLRPKASSGIGIGVGSLAQAVKISGSLADPGVGVDAAGAVKAAGTIGAAIATGGISALLQGAKSRVDTAKRSLPGRADVAHQVAFIATQAYGD